MIRIVSWNIELGLNLDQAVTELRSEPDLRNADIILLQEMSPSGTQRVAENLNMDYRYAAPARHPDTGQPFGNAVLSPWPMDHLIEIPLPHTAPIQGQPRTAVGTTIRLANTTVTAFSVHLETVLLSITRRVQQLATLTTALPTHTDHPVVVGGDFNTASKRSNKQFNSTMNTAGLKPLSRSSNPTFRRFGRDFTLDHIYGRDLTMKTSGVAHNAQASDHRPVWATAKPTPRQTQNVHHQQS